MYCSVSFIPNLQYKTILISGEDFCLIYVMNVLYCQLSLTFSKKLFYSLSDFCLIYVMNVLFCQLSLTYSTKLF